MEPDSISSVRKSAEESFASRLYCAESVVLALAKVQGIDSELLPKAATAFCSGMARTCGTCGALSGAIMRVGLAAWASAAPGIRARQQKLLPVSFPKQIPRPHFEMRQGPFVRQHPRRPTDRDRP